MGSQKDKGWPKSNNIIQVPFTNKALNQAINSLRLETSSGLKICASELVFTG